MQWLGDILSNWFYNIASTTLLLIAQFFCKLIRAFEDIYFWLLGTQAIPDSSNLNVFDLIIKDSRITGYIGIFFTIAGGRPKKNIVFRKTELRMEPELYDNLCILAALDRRSVNAYLCMLVENAVNLPQNRELIQKYLENE